MGMAPATHYYFHEEIHICSAKLILNAITKRPPVCRQVDDKRFLISLLSLGLRPNTLCRYPHVLPRLQ